MEEARKFSIVKPTLQTPFHIDFNWWRENDCNWRVDLRSLLCPEHQEVLAAMPEDQVIDWIDPETAEVKQMDGLQNMIISHCAKREEFLTEQTALVDAVFRLMLTTGNIPMSAQELAEQLRRPADVILRTFSGPRVYKGIRPYQV